MTTAVPATTAAAPMETASPTMAPMITAAPASTAGATGGGQAVETPAPAEGPPPIPHSLAGREQCLTCHATGSTIAPPIPANPNHAAYTNEMCQTCHKPIAQATPSP